MRIVTLNRGNTGDRVDTERRGGHSKETDPAERGC